MLKHVATGLVVALVGGCRVVAMELVKQPNIIFILADDLGYGDLGCYGNTINHTPNLDRMAAEGMRWTQFYAASAVCSPSRSSCLTGRFPYRFGFKQHCSKQFMPEVIGQNIMTLPRLLKDVGYNTAHVGKMHLQPSTWRSVGFDQAVINYYWESDLYHKAGHHLWRNDELLSPSGKFLTEVLTDQALGFIEEYGKSGKPFLLDMWYVAPHSPYNLAPKPYHEIYLGRHEGDDLKYRSMITCMDAQIGRLVEKVRELGLLENTLFVFTSDNGPSYQGSTGGLSGGKTDLHEGGTRVPMIAFWPGQIPAGVVCDEVAQHVDLLPTFADVAGCALPADIQYDGISLLPRFVEGCSLPSTRHLYWQLNPYKNYQRYENRPLPHATETVRFGQWKMLARDGTPTELFNLEEDPKEKTNMLGQMPEMVRRLTDELQIYLQSGKRRPTR